MALDVAGPGSGIAFTTTVCAGTRIAQQLLFTWWLPCDIEAQQLCADLRVCGKQVTNDRSSVPINRWASTARRRTLLDMAQAYHGCCCVL